ncbi:MAG: acetolactate decarboxylase [Candidatus Hydrogenedentes bacterium]|nr:acetolactate decarboxylase [Candidatus Hydrogenedentota bacterium]
MALVLCSIPASGRDAEDPVVQFSTIDALAAGHYEGTWRLSEARRFGDFGIGTLDGLDGETILLDGKMFQAKADGTVLSVPKKALIPFATVTHFDPAAPVRLDGAAGIEQLAALLDEALPKGDCFCAIRIDAAWDAVTVRSCPKQCAPYRPLAEVTKEQSVFDLRNVSGTLVGFRYPKYIQGLNMPGYHFHFISDDRKTGGHVLNCQFKEATVQVDTTREFRLFLLPNPSAKK